jgi:hypothetical protein
MACLSNSARDLRAHDHAALRSDAPGEIVEGGEKAGLLCLLELSLGRTRGTIR